MPIGQVVVPLGNQQVATSSSLQGELSDGGARNKLVLPPPPVKRNTLSAVWLPRKPCGYQDFSPT